jgi:hypothetical protein
VEQIAKTEYYELQYDSNKNWIYWTMRGFWETMSVVPDFEKDWNRAVQATRPAWKIFADLTELKVMPDDVKQANDLQQQRLMQMGCKKVSCLMESSVTKASLNDVIKSSGMEKMVQYFTKAESHQAADWLAE